MMKTKKFFFMFLCLILFISFVLVVPASARWRDGTGPEGLGPRTGRGMGNCTDYSLQGTRNTNVYGLGLGRTAYQRGGRGYRNIYKATGLTQWQRSSTVTPSNTVQPFVQPSVQPSVSKEQHLETLKQQVEVLANQLKQLLQEIENIESEK